MSEYEKYHSSKRMKDERVKGIETEEGYKKTARLRRAMVNILTTRMETPITIPLKT